jgi:hypothetical protein
VELCLAAHLKRPVRDITEVFDIDRETRETSNKILKQRT